MKTHTPPDLGTVNDALYATLGILVFLKWESLLLKVVYAERVGTPRKPV